MVRRIQLGLATLVAVLGLATAASSQQLRINEVFVNPPGTDNGQEYFELIGAPSFSMTGLTFLVIEGDGAGAGTIDVALSLTGLSTGTNGLFLWRDAAGAILPGAAAGTSINVADFNPDLENGSNTFMIVNGFTGAVGNVLDNAAPDGILDVTPWTSVLDAVGFRENDAGNNFSYAAQFGGVDLGPQATFNGDALMRRRDNGEWVYGDVIGTNPGGPYSWDNPRFANQSGSLDNSANYDFQTLTPGDINLALIAVPEPTTLTLLGLVAGGFGVRQWSKRRRTKVAE